MNAVSAVVSQHVEEAAILWLRRDLAAVEPHYRLEDLTTVDRRLDAHLDGLRVGEAAAPGAVWRLCRQELEWEEAGEVFAAAILGLESAPLECLARVVEVAVRHRDLSRPLVSALAWLPEDRGWRHIVRLLGEADPRLRRAGIAAAAGVRQDPGAVLVESVHHQDESLRARSLRAVGELGRIDLLGAIREHLQDRESDCRYAAAWSTTLLSADDESKRLLQQTVAAGDQQTGERALQLILRRLPVSETQAWLLELADHGVCRARMAIIGSGVLGRVDLVPWVIEQMEAPGLSRVAGEAFSMITGVDIAYEDLEGERPEGVDVRPNDDPADEHVAMDPDENLPWPDIPKIKDWWMRHRHEFEPGVRCLCGRPMTEDWLEHVLRYGYQRQRAAAALELAIRRPGQPLFNVRAPGYRQQQWLGMT